MNQLRVLIYMRLFMRLCLFVVSCLLSVGRLLFVVCFSRPNCVLSPSPVTSSGRLSIAHLNFVYAQAPLDTPVSEYRSFGALGPCDISCHDI